MNKKNIKDFVKTKTNKIDLLSKEMNLNHEIITFKDVDISSSKIYIRMMLRGEKIIKKYKKINLDLNELCKNIKEKKNMNFPYKSKLVFNYNLTKDKNEVTQIINEIKNNKENKKSNNIFKINEDDDDENIAEESEDSTKEIEENKESDNNLNKVEIKENNDKTNNLKENRSLTFQERLTLFETNKHKISILNSKDININRSVTFINYNQEFKEKFSNSLNFSENNKKDKNINQIIENENENIDEKNDNKEESNINDDNIPKIAKGQKKNSIIIKEPTALKSKIFQEKIDSNISSNNSEQTLIPKKIDLSKEQNLESFCNYFFLCSFPYKNGKVIENSKNYKSPCGHPICSRLLSMEPEIIFKYPSNDNIDLELNNLSASICFPSGIKICYNQDRRPIYKPFSTHIISKQGQKYYMVIYHFYRKLDSMTYNQLYCDNPLKIYLRKFGDNTFCNKYEQEELEKDLAECQELGFRDFVFIPYSIVLISKYPYINQMKTCLNIIYKIMSNEKEILKDIIDNDTTNLIKDLLSYLIYSIPIPIANSEIYFNLPLLSDNIKISSPYKDKVHDLEVLNFPYIISKLCPENIIDIYRLILFEQKILFINKDYNNISSVIDSFTNVLYPIDWINTIIPIMSSPMVKYLQTYLPFINGISEDLYENSAKQALEDAEEGVFLIFIYNDTIIYSKQDCEEDFKSSFPKLPDNIHKKLYSELHDLKSMYIKLKEEEKEKYAENVNNIAKNIFFESTCIMLYDLIDIMLEEEKEFDGFSSATLINIYEKDASFYKELIETQIFQSFINNFINRKKDYTSFICMLKNISEKYVKPVNERKKKWKKITRKIGIIELAQFPITFRIPLHLLNPEEVTMYIIKNKQWQEINNKIEQKQNNQENEDILQNKIVPENERTSSKIIEINSELKSINKDIYRYEISNKSDNKKRARLSFSINMNNSLLLNKLNEQSKLKDLSDSLKEKIKKDFSSLINLIISNKKIETADLNNINIEEYSSYVYYDIGRNILSKAIYKKGFRVTSKLNEDNFNYLSKICTNALISLCDAEENIINLEFAVKITSSAFYFCKEKSLEYLIDDLRNNLGEKYYFWNKESFWNTWQIMENYFSHTNFSTYCQIIMYDFSNKLLRLKLNKEFIISYLISSLGEKLFLLENNNSNRETDTENQLLFSENKTKIKDIVNNCAY